MKVAVTGASGHIGNCQNSRDSRLYYRYSYLCINNIWL